MANKKITDLTNLQTPVANSEFVVVDIQNDETKSITFANLNVAIQANTGVTAGLYGGVIGTETNVAAITVGADGRITSASNVTVQVDLPTLEGNVNTVSSNVELVGANTKGLSSVGHTITSTANIHPGANNTYTLGAPDAVFSEVYVGPNSLKLGSLTISDTGGETLTITGASGQKGNISTASVSGVANLTSNVITLETDLTALEARRSANNTLLSDEDTALQSRLTTNVTLLTNEDTALQARITANNTLSHSNDFITFTRLNANLDVIQDNVALITDGTTAFTGEVTMNDDLIITGNLIVNGAQVDLGVTTATISNNLIELSAELGPTDTPTTDSGLLINRGNQGNVFIGKSVADHGVIFAHTLSPDTNVTIAIDEYMDAHANAFHSARNPDLDHVHFGLVDAEDTGIIVDDSGANINFVADGAYIANVHYDGTLNSQNAIIAPAVFSDGVELQANDYATYTTLDTRIDTVSSNADAIESRRTANIAGAISTVLTTDLTASRALIAGTGGKIEVSDITSTELAFLDGLDQNLNSNLEALAAGIAGQAITSLAPTGDYGLLDAANSATDAFGVATAGLTTFDMKTEPAGSLNTQDLGALT